MKEFNERYGAPASGGLAVNEPAEEEKTVPRRKDSPLKARRRRRLSHRVTPNLSWATSLFKV